jgi:hypothetical protein
VRDFSEGFIIRFIYGQIQKDFAFFKCFGKALKRLDFIGNQGALFQNGFGIIWLIPETVFGNNRLYFL